MILTYVNAGTSGSEGINYLFSEKDANGKLRNPPAELLSGDLFLTKYLIEHNQREKKYSSYALSFRDNETVTDDQLKEILQSLRDTFCTGLGPERVNILAVKHTDKSNIEVHIILNDEDLATGRQFNPFPPGERSKILQRDFCAYWNHKLGYEQVVSNPFKPSFSRFDAKTPVRRKEEYSKNLGNGEVATSKERKEKLSSIVAKAIMDGRINNRRDLISFLQKKECKVTREGTDYLSIKLPGKEKAMRFKGGAFVENVDYRALIAEHNRSAKHLAPYQFKKIKDRLNAAMDYKRELHAKIYVPRKPRPPKAHKFKPISLVRVKTSWNQPLEIKLKKDIQTPIRQCSKKKLTVKKEAVQASASNISVLNSHEALGVSMASVENKIFSLGLKLSQVPPERKTQIEFEIAALKIQLAKMQQQLADAKIAELNKDSARKPKRR